MYYDFRHVLLQLSVGGGDTLYLLQFGQWAFDSSLTRVVLTGCLCLLILVGPLVSSGPV